MTEERKVKPSYVHMTRRIKNRTIMQRLKGIFFTSEFLKVTNYTDNRIQFEDETVIDFPDEFVASGFGNYLPWSPQDIRKVKLEEGDRILVSIKEAINPEIAEIITQEVHKWAGREIEVMVLDNSMSMCILAKEDVKGKLS